MVWLPFTHVREYDPVYVLPEARSTDPERYRIRMRVVDVVPQFPLERELRFVKRSDDQKQHQYLCLDQGHWPNNLQTLETTLEASHKEAVREHTRQHAHEYQWQPVPDLNMGACVLLQPHRLLHYRPSVTSDRNDMWHHFKWGHLQSEADMTACGQSPGCMYQDTRAERLFLCTEADAEELDLLFLRRKREEAAGIYRYELQRLPATKSLSGPG